MLPEHMNLMQRLRGYDFDGRAMQPFTVRLAEENGWSVARALRVLEEYRRFCFLAVAAGHPVSPSDAVDQAWHLHLIYTRSYWDEWCPQVLGTSLHHGPSLGGGVEHAKFQDWYARTLESYERLLGEVPPADIWPRPEHKAAAEGQHQRVDVSRHLLLPLPRWLCRWLHQAWRLCRGG